MAAPPSVKATAGAGVPLAAAEKLTEAPHRAGSTFTRRLAMAASTGTSHSVVKATLVEAAVWVRLQVLVTVTL